MNVRLLRQKRVLEEMGAATFIAGKWRSFVILRIYLFFSISIVEHYQYAID